MCSRHLGTVLHGENHKLQEHLFTARTRGLCRWSHNIETMFSFSLSERHYELFQEHELERKEDGTRMKTLGFSPFKKKTTKHSCTWLVAFLIQLMGIY